MRVGRIPYLNSEPFYFDLPGHELIALPPRALGQALAEGRVDAGPVSLVDVFRLEPELSALALGIATRGPARSVILFSDRPAKELEGAVVGVTDETSTSVQILRLVLLDKYGVRPSAWVGTDDPADATLLIGDRALRALQTDGLGDYRIDIGEEWFEWTGLPCVFARWVVRTSRSHSDRAALAVAVQASLERGLGSLSDIAERRQDVGLDPVGVETYLRGFTYRFGADEERAIAELRRRLAALGPQ